MRQTNEPQEWQVKEFEACKRHCYSQIPKVQYHARQNGILDAMYFHVQQSPDEEFLSKKITGTYDR